MASRGVQLRPRARRILLRLTLKVTCIKVVVVKFVGLLASQERPAGLMLHEVGSLSDLLGAQQRQELDCLLTEAFYECRCFRARRPIYRLEQWRNGSCLPQ